MTDYLNYQFNDSSGFVETYDELPLWSAPFGLLLLKYLDLKPNITVLDIGSGAGFPLIELAERLGSSCKCFGLDPWINANNKAKQKLKNYGVANVTILDGTAEKIPFESESIDLIVSNLGINNFDNPVKVFKECNRVLKRNGRLALTTNLEGHWKEFYSVFEETLKQLQKVDLLRILKEHLEHRGTTATVSKLFNGNGFALEKCVEDKFEMRFLNGSSFLSHHFVKLGWLGSWKNIIPEGDQVLFFKLLEEKLNIVAEKSDGLFLTVPMAFMEGRKT